MQKLLKSTTSLGLCLALAVPHGAFAQSGVADCGPEGTQTPFPCTLEGNVVENEEELLVLRELLTAEQEATADTEATTEIAPEATGSGEAQTDATADADAQTEAEAAQAAEAQAAADQAAADQAAADQAAADQAAADQAAADQAAADQAAADQAAADQAAADQAAADQAAADQAAADQAAADQAAADQAAADAEAKIAEDLAAQQAADEAAAAAEAEAEAEATAEAEAEAAATAEADAAQEDEAAAAKEERKAARKAERQAERRAQRQAEAAAAAAAAADTEADAEVVTEEVTDADVRSSDEEFETDVTAAATAEAASDDDDGLSKFEKALLLGLGAVAVGAVLKNGDKVVSRSGDRVVVEDPDGTLRVLKDDDALIRRPGDEVRTETFNDGSSRTTVVKPDGTQVVTIRGRDGTVLRRVNVDAQGREFILFDDTVAEQEVIVNELPQVREASAAVGTQNEAALRAALQAELTEDQGRVFSLRQIRDITEVRALAPQLELDAVRFDTGSAAIKPEQARSLAKIGTTLSELIAQDPRTVILVEGHTDAVGDATYNLALSDRRAETVALALTEYFDVPAENMIVQGYGESALRVPTLTAEPANRRAVVRNITGLLR